VVYGEMIVGGFVVRRWWSAVNWLLVEFLQVVNDGCSGGYDLGR